MADHFSARMQLERRQATTTRLPAATSISRPATAAPVATTRAAAAVGSVGAAYTDTDTAIAPTTPPTGVVLTTRANSLYSESFAAVASTSFVPTQTAIANPNASNGNSNSNPTSGSSAAADSGSQPILTRPALYGIIGGGSALVAILLGVIAWWFWRKKRAIKEERSWWKLNEAGQSPDGKSGGRSAIDRDPGYLAGEGSRSFSREKGDDGQGMESESTRFGAGAASGRPQFSSKKSDPSVRSQSTYYQQAPGPVTAAATRAELFAPAAPVRRDQNHVNDVITFGGDDTQPRYPPSPPRQAPQGAAPVTHAYSSGPSSNRPFSTKDLPPLRPNFRPTQAPQNSRSQAPPPTQRLLEAPLNGEQYSRAGIPLPTPSRSESLAPDSRSRAYGGGVVDPLSRHEERNRERREMERLRSAPSPESNAGINGAQSAWADLQPQATDSTLLSATNDPVRTTSKRVRPPLPSPMTLASSNDPGPSARSRQDDSAESSFVKADPVQSHSPQASSRAPAQYARVDSRPLQDLEDILDSFAYKPQGDKHLNSTNSSSRSASNASRASEMSGATARAPQQSAGPIAASSDPFLVPAPRSLPRRQDDYTLRAPDAHRQPAPSNSSRSAIGPTVRTSPVKSSNPASSSSSPSKQQGSRATPANHGVTPSQGSSVDFVNSDVETHLVRKVSLRRSPSNPIRLETLRDQQQSHQGQRRAQGTGNSPPRSSNSSPSFDHSLDSATSSASPTTPRDQHHSAFTKDQQYQQNYPSSHLYPTRTQVDSNGRQSVGQAPDQRYSSKSGRSATDSIYGSYYDDDDRIVS